MSGGFSNPFSVLATKNSHNLLSNRGRGGGDAGKKDKKGVPKENKTAAPREPKAVKQRLKDDQKEATPAPAEEAPKKESKTISLTAEMAKAPAKTEKELKKEEHLEAKVQKVQNDRTDRQDRSGKAQRVRKEGKGTGGWEESKPLPEDTAPVPEQPADEGPAWGAAATTDGETPAADAAAAPAAPEKPVVELSEEEKKRREEERLARELEEKQMTLDEYLTKQKKDKALEATAFNVRKVDKAPLANMIKQKQKGNQELRVTTKKATPAPAAPAAPAKPKAEKPAEKEKKVEKKVDLSEVTGFRMENPAVREMGGRGGGRGRGRDGGFEGGRGGRGFGRGNFGRGRGGYAGNNREGGGGGAAPAESAAPQMDSEALFPALRPAGSPTGAAATTEPEKAAVSAA